MVLLVAGQTTEGQVVAFAAPAANGGRPDDGTCIFEFQDAEGRIHHAVDEVPPKRADFANGAVLVRYLPCAPGTARLARNVTPLYLRTLIAGLGSGLWFAR